MNQARKLAARESTTFKALVELGLRRIIAEQRQAGNFRLRRAGFKGKGLRSELKNTSWERLCELAYEERGG